MYCLEMVLCLSQKVAKNGEILSMFVPQKWLFSFLVQPYSSIGYGGTGTWFPINGSNFFALGNKSGSFCEAVNCEQSEQEGKFLFAI